jgi:fatty acid desaturase
MFTVMHESIHGNIYRKNHYYEISKDIIQVIAGRVACACFLIPYPVFRYAHLSHHSATNNEEKDPDMYSCGPVGMKWFPLSWMTQGIYYYVFFFRNISHHSYFYICESLVSTALYITMLYYLGWYGFFWITGQRVLEVVLIYFLSYITHHPHNITPSENKFRTTNKINGWYWDYIMVMQNYHIVHHIYPYIQWYLYKSVWNAHHEDFIRHGTHEIDVYFDEESLEIMIEQIC